MGLGTQLSLVVLALGGESTGGAESTFLGVLTILSVVAVAVGLGAVWYFFFRDRSR